MGWVLLLLDVRQLQHVFMACVFGCVWKMARKKRCFFNFFIPQPIPQAIPQVVPEVIPHCHTAMSSRNVIPQPIPHTMPHAIPQVIPQPIPQATPRAIPQCHSTSHSTTHSANHATCHSTKPCLSAMSFRLLHSPPGGSGLCRQTRYFLPIFNCYMLTNV